MLLFLSSGQKLFTLFFALVFTVALIMAYQKDIKYSRLFYKKNYWVFLGIIVFLMIVFIISRA